MKFVMFIFTRALGLSLWAPWTLGKEGDEFWWMLLKTYAIFGLMAPICIFLVLLSNLLTDKLVRNIGRNFNDIKMVLLRPGRGAER